ncbi:hypothetical protein DOY81_008120 [Sarcophaga bullata]|nr:hypothetical protein DOY81_008120 [Sarcophaga bullata]
MKSLIIVLCIFLLVAMGFGNPVNSGQPAVLQSCPVAHGFLDPVKECVHFSLWYWTPTVAPPSAPATEASTTVV